MNIVLFKVGCNNNIVDPSANKAIDRVKSYTHFLWPSKKSSYWIYDRYIIPFSNNDSNWTYNNFESFGIDMDTVKIQPRTFQTEITDSIYITLNDTIFPSVVLNTGFRIPYYIGLDGIYNMGIFEEGGDTLFKKGLYLPTEISLNEPWNGQMSFRQEGKFRAEEVIDRRCLSFKENINTPIGNLECYVIKTRIREAEDYPGFLDFYEYYLPNVGLVAKVRIFILPSHYWFLDYIDILKNYNSPN